MSPWLAVALGLVLLLGGGDLLVRGASRSAALLGISPLVIGLTVVAFGTSAPELAVSVQSALAGAGDLAVGNVVGSNIFNVLLVLGLSALLAPLTVSLRLVQVEVPIMLLISILVLLLAWDGRLSLVDGLVLAGAVAAYTAWMLRSGRASPGADPDPSSGSGGLARAVVLAAVGLALLVAGARSLVTGAVQIAEALGVDQAVIGLTIVAAGTSLPEVATSMIAAARGQRDLVTGNVIGSNIFNLTAILGTSVLASGGLPVAAGVLTFDMVVMLAAAVACLPIFFTGHVIARWEGGVFFAYYIAYTTYLVLDATQHGALPAFSNAVLWFALPLTAVTLLVLMVRERSR